MASNKKIHVQGIDVILYEKNNEEYISLTDIARYKNDVEPFSVINNWMRNRSTIDFIGLWEKLYNPDFKPLEFERFKMESGSNYKIHTDAIKESLIPTEVTAQQAAMVYATEADLLNVALFGVTAKQWRDALPLEKGNIRDAASLEQLVVLSNMESINALLISQEIPQNQRLIQLNKVAITQMKSLLENSITKKIH